ncbi:MAG: penicillin-binding transpeptidase domain-containing protein [Oscillospiraceae bacterium]|nr:penicillin-binding transpeptidase domain-containing protein [Oscillospiraceae bacterium]
MQKLYKPLRVGFILAFMAAISTIFVSALYKLQVYDTRPAEEQLYPRVTVSRTQTLTASRGNIYDRNGVLLASGRPTYNITLDWLALTAAPDMNAIIQELIFAAMDEDVAYIDTLPITRGAPFTYLSEMTASQRSRLGRYFEYYEARLDPDISESDLLAWLRGHYRIDYTVGISEARLIIGVRYELEIRNIIQNLAPYVFASDVSPSFVSLVEERALVGVNVEVGYVREYHTSYAAHLLGYISSMSPAQLEKYSQLGYPMDALVGQTGAELAFEDILHGVDGSQSITSSSTGAVLSVTTKSEPVPGRNVYLTMDIGLQEATEDALRLFIESSNAEIEDETEKIPGGAVVITNVWTGELLASASYPTFDRATLFQNFAFLNSDPTNPLYDRAAQGQYYPGSTFKMVTAFCGLREGVIGRWTEIDDVGKYDKYIGDGTGYAPSCWIYPSSGVGHGPLNVVNALERSCNYFFIAVSDRLNPVELAEERDITISAAAGYTLAAAASEFGLGQKTGIEVPERAGILSSPEYKMNALHDGWYSADTLMTAFGQGHNKFTPLQLANYAATIANGGTRYSLTLLRRIKSADLSELLYVHTPEAVHVIEETEYIQILQEGMRAVTRTPGVGTAAREFADYPIKVAAKTGTVQVESQDINNGVFVCYAPAENPEIAISVVVEKGGSGSAIMSIARNVLDYYFRTGATVLSTPFGELVP